MTLEIHANRLINLLTKANASTKYTEYVEFLKQDNYIGLASTKGPIFVALKKSEHLICLLCSLSEKIDVTFKTKRELLNHVKVAHPRLFDSIMQLDF